MALQDNMQEGHVPPGKPPGQKKPVQDQASGSNLQLQEIEGTEETTRQIQKVGALRNQPPRKKGARTTGQKWL